MITQTQTLLQARLIVHLNTSSVGFWSVKSRLFGPIMSQLKNDQKCFLETQRTSTSSISKTFPYYCSSIKQNFYFIIIHSTLILCQLDCSIPLFMFTLSDSLTYIEFCWILCQAFHPIVAFSGSFSCMLDQKHCLHVKCLRVHIATWTWLQWPVEKNCLGHC